MEVLHHYTIQLSHLYPSSQIYDEFLFFTQKLYFKFCLMFLNRKKVH